VTLAPDSVIRLRDGRRSLCFGMRLDTVMDGVRIIRAGERLTRMT
jgi:hypothetical protein